MRRNIGALAAVLGAVAVGGSFLSTGVAMAATPSGVACAANDGKINGRGATYQTNAQALFWNGFNTDVCGNTPSTGGDVAGNNMGIYNYPTAVAGSFTGSGAGKKAANCRTDAYAGSDIPYSENELANGFNGTPGNAVIGGCSTFPVQPFAPNTAPFPNTNDQTAPIMSYPVAGSAESIMINLTAADCGGTKPTGVQLTPAQVAAIWDGSVTNWNALGVSSLANCNVPITRVVRFDSSGTTTIFKNYLIRVDDARTGNTCASGTTWTTFNTPAGSTSWPKGTGCSPVVDGGSSGGPSLITKLTATDGGVGYADLSDQVNLYPTAIVPSIQNAIGTAYTSPSSGKGANCDFSSLSLPGFSASDAVGLNTGDNWGVDNASVNGQADHVNATDLGAKYPICGITFALVYSGLSAGSVSAISSLTNDQRRTLYSFETYILSSTAQGKLGSNYYAALPSTWLGTLQSGFQSNF